MPLPKCVKINPHDKPSREALIGDGWRYVGTLITYEGDPHPRHRHLIDKVEECTREEAIKIAEQVTWSGRLWRDPLVPDELAWAETKRFLESGQTSVYKIGNEAFIARTQDTIDLIGVIPSAQGGGLAERIIRDTTDGMTWAGTYDDNEAAKRLYGRKLYMSEEKKEAVFHK